MNKVKGILIVWLTCFLVLSLISISINSAHWQHNLLMSAVIPIVGVLFVWGVVSGINLTARDE